MVILIRIYGNFFEIFIQKVIYSLSNVLKACWTSNPFYIFPLKSCFFHIFFFFFCRYVVFTISMIVLDEKFQHPTKLTKPSIIINLRNIARVWLRTCSLYGDPWWRLECTNPEIVRSVEQLTFSSFLWITTTLMITTWLFLIDISKVMMEMWRHHFLYMIALMIDR